jgi:hypothetical protein
VASILRQQPDLLVLCYTIVSQCLLAGLNSCHNIRDSADFAFSMIASGVPFAFGFDLLDIVCETENKDRAYQMGATDKFLMAITATG